MAVAEIFEEAAPEARVAEPVRLGVHGFAWTSLSTFFAMAGLVALTSFLAVTGVAPYWLAVPANAVCLYVIAHINHEAFHGNISGTAHKLKWLNEAIGRFISFTFWFSMPAFRAVHAAHHRFTNDPEMDADRWMARKNPLAVMLACFTLQMHYEYKMWGLLRKGFISKRIVIEFYIERAMAIALVVAAFRFGYGYEAVMLWLLPAYLTLPFLALMFAYIVHHPHTTEGGEHRRSNVIVSKNPVLQSAMTAAFVFQNYHLVHHLHPRIPFYLYGKTFRAQRAAMAAQHANIIEI
ncbi:MAG: fatty acid desaturase [Parvularculaceae bacterium]